jgi:hypothetical protein
VAPVRRTSGKCADASVGVALDVALTRGAVVAQQFRLIEGRRHHEPVHGRLRKGAVAFGPAGQPLDGPGGVLGVPGGRAPRRPRWSRLGQIRGGRTACSGGETPAGRPGRSCYAPAAHPLGVEQSPSTAKRARLVAAAQQVEVGVHFRRPRTRARRPPWRRHIR